MEEVANRQRSTPNPYQIHGVLPLLQRRRQREILVVVSDFRRRQREVLVVVSDFRRRLEEVARIATTMVFR